MHVYLPSMTKTCSPAKKVSVELTSLASKVILPIVQYRMLKTQKDIWVSKLANHLLAAYTANLSGKGIIKTKIKKKKSKKYLNFRAT